MVLVTSFRQVAQRKYGRGIGDYWQSAKDKAKYLAYIAKDPIKTIAMNLLGSAASTSGQVLASKLLPLILEKILTQGKGLTVPGTGLYLPGTYRGGQSFAKLFDTFREIPLIKKAEQGIYKALPFDVNQTAKNLGLPSVSDVIRRIEQGGISKKKKGSGASRYVLGSGFSETDSRMNKKAQKLMKGLVKSIKHR